MTTPRPELTPMPARIARLPVDARGYPVPWFVPWQDGVPEFRAMDAAKWRLAVRDKRCWVCGEALGVNLTFPIGPMCAIARTTPEPPSHDDCALWSVINCPFLSRPHAKRREDEQINAATYAEQSPGEMIARNPGVICLWGTRRYETFPDGKGQRLIHVGPPERVRWFAESRPATRAEVQASISSGLPLLEATAREHDGPAGLAELQRRAEVLTRYLPGEEVPC